MDDGKVAYGEPGVDGSIGGDVDVGVDIDFAFSYGDGTESRLATGFDGDFALSDAYADDQPGFGHRCYGRVGGAPSHVVVGIERGCVGGELVDVADFEGDFVGEEGYGFDLVFTSRECYESRKEEENVFFHIG